MQDKAGHIITSWNLRVKHTRKAVVLQAYCRTTRYCIPLKQTCNTFRTGQP